MNITLVMKAILVLCLLFVSHSSILTPQHIEQHIKNLISQKYQLYVINLGTTVNNNPLKAYVISGIKKQQSSITQLLNYPATLITSYMHPREPYSIKLMQTVLDEVLNNYHTDYFFRYMLDNTLLILFPFVNIDGYYLYERLVNQKAPKSLRQSYRKNMNKYGQCIKDWQFGVDINRNFDSAWGSLRTSDNQCGEEYRGPSPFSQKQSRAIRTLFNKFKINLAIDIHSYGNQWIYPYASQTTTDKFESHQLYPLYEDLFKEFNRLNRSMKGCYESLGYTADGVYIDWALDQGALSFAVEIGQSFDQDIDIGREILFQTQQLFHIVLRKNSISYSKHKSQNNHLIITSTSLLDFNVEVFSVDGESLGQRVLRSRKSILYRMDAQNRDKVTLKVIETKIEQEIIINQLDLVQFDQTIEESIIESRKNTNKWNNITLVVVVVSTVSMVVFLLIRHLRESTQTDISLPKSTKTPTLQQQLPDNPQPSSNNLQQQLTQLPQQVNETQSESQTLFEQEKTIQTTNHQQQDDEEISTDRKMAS